MKVFGFVNERIVEKFEEVIEKFTGEVRRKLTLVKLTAFCFSKK
jgi:hypothetical protein